MLTGDLLNPSKLWLRSEVLVRDCPVPRVSGVYAWYFKEPPPGVPTTGCRRALGATLLYIVICARRAERKETLRSCIRYHFRGNAYGSTLRLTFGCLLTGTLGIGLC